MTAFDHWTAMHAWWVARRIEKEAVGRPWPPRASGRLTGVGTIPAEGVGEDPTAGATPTPTPGSADGSATPADPTRRDQLKARYNELGPDAQKAYKALKIPKGDLDAVEAALNDLESDEFQGTLEPPTVIDLAQRRMAADKERRPVAPPAPDEGDEIPLESVDAIKKAFRRLPPAAKKWTAELVKQGNAGHPWRMDEGKPTVRRFELYRGVLALAEYPGDDPENTESFCYLDEITRAAVNIVRPDLSTDIHQPGWMLSLLDAEQAAEFAALTTALTLGYYVLNWGPSGPPLLQPTNQGTGA